MNARNGIAKAVNRFCIIVKDFNVPPIFDPKALITRCFWRRQSQ